MPLYLVGNRARSSRDISNAAVAAERCPGSAAPTALATGRSELQCAYPHVLRAVDDSVYSGVSGDYTRESMVFCRLYGALGSTGKVAGLAGKAFTVLRLQQWLRFTVQIGREQVLAAVFTVYCGGIVYRLAQHCQVFFRIKSVLFVLVLGCFAIHPSAILFAQDTGPLISDLDWSPDGQRVAAATGRWEEAEWAGGPQVDCESVFGLYFVDAATSEVTFMEVEGLLCSPTTIDFNPTGMEVVYTYFSGYGAIDLNDRRVRQAVTAYAFYHSIFWHPDGNSVLVTADYAVGTVDHNMIDGASGPSLGRSDIPNAGFSFRYSVWSPDARCIATTTAVDGRIYIVRGNQVARAFAQHTAPVRRFVWNAATNLIASGDDTGRVLVWNPDSGEVVRELIGHTAPILDIDWNADGSQIATASRITPCVPGTGPPERGGSSAVGS